MDDNINAIDRTFWTGKTSVKISDLEKSHLGVAKLEDVNRVCRIINRRATANTNALNKMANDMNTNIMTINAQIRSITDKLERIERSSILRDKDDGDDTMVDPDDLLVNQNKSTKEILLLA